MTLNVTIFGELVFYSMFVIGGLSYYLGRRKTNNPKMTALIGVLLCLTPPLNLVHLIVLSIKNDIASNE